MNKQKRLSLYKKALVDYRNIIPIYDAIQNEHWDEKYDNISSGFCWYFEKQHSVFIEDKREFEKTFPELYQQRKLDYSFHYEHKVSDSIKGVTERIEALENAIKAITQ